MIQSTYSTPLFFYSSKSPGVMLSFYIKRKKKNKEKWTKFIFVCSLGFQRCRQRQWCALSVCWWVAFMQKVQKEVSLKWEGTNAGVCNKEEGSTVKLQQWIALCRWMTCCGTVCHLVLLCLFQLAYVIVCGRYWRLPVLMAGWCIFVFHSVVVISRYHYLIQNLRMILRCLLIEKVKRSLWKAHIYTPSLV